jgi:ubiquinol-cytochrome c reductase cytochrome b subunit
MNGLFDGMFPGSPKLWPRMYIAHVLIFPILIGLLLGAHLLLVAMRHHTQFRSKKAQTERTIVGVPAWPGQAPRSLGLMVGTAGFLFLLGGLVQINPVWLWGPYHVGASTNGAQPDWYLGWLIGALRLVPGFDLVIDHRTLIPNPFWGGVLVPSIVFGVLFLWPWLERKLARDHEPHNLLQRPRDNPWRTAIGAATVAWVFVVFAAGSADRVDVLFGLNYENQIDVYRIVVWAVPALVLLIAHRTCRELQAGERVARLRREAGQPQGAPTRDGTA